MRSTLRHVLAAPAAAVLLAACGGMMRGPATPAGTRGTAADTVARPYSPVDVRFMHRMLLHHVQALEIMQLARSQASRSDVRILALRMELTLRDEMALMRYWLENRGEPAVAAQGGPAPTPGMPSGAQLDSLRSAKGTAFDQLFLRTMIQHDEAVLAMSTEHLRTPGAARQPETHRFVTSIGDERRAELHRLRTALAEPQ